MPATSNHADHNQISAPPDLPGFTGFAVRTSNDPVLPIADEEKALLHRRAVAERQETFHLGRTAAHLALTDIGRDAGPILAGEHRQPIWPRNVAGSISHITGAAVALVAPAEMTDGIGIDIERIRHAPELEAQVPRSEERAWLDELPGSQRANDLFALFSAKESIFKAFFPHAGFFFGFEAASLRPRTYGFEARLVSNIDSRYPSTRTFDVGCRWFGDVVMTWLVLPAPSS